MTKQSLPGSKSASLIDAMGNAAAAVWLSWAQFALLSITSFPSSMADRTAKETCNCSACRVILKRRDPTLLRRQLHIVSVQSI